MAWTVWAPQILISASVKWFIRQTRTIGVEGGLQMCTLRQWSVITVANFTSCTHGGRLVVSCKSTFHFCRDSILSPGVAFIGRSVILPQRRKRPFPSALVYENSNRKKRPAMRSETALYARLVWGIELGPWHFTCISVQTNLLFNFFF